MNIKTVLSLFVAGILLLGCQPAMEMDQYGETLASIETTSISSILAEPESFVGKKVKIEGRIKDVCPMQGCWIEVETADGQKVLKVKVNDGEIVFKSESIGKQVIAEGEVYSIDLTQEEAVSYMEHLAEEKGEAFDPASIEGPMVIYQVKGAGALVEK